MREQETIEETVIAEDSVDSSNRHFNIFIKKRDHGKKTKLPVSSYFHSSF